jgi:thymidylate synthase (FAD)
MKVQLISYTHVPMKVIGAAARGCYSDKSSGDLYRDMEPEDYIPLVQRVIESGHTSVLEHAVYTFSIEGISRACSHQLVRHRIASYSQQSQRYVRYPESQYHEDEEYQNWEDIEELFVVPPSIAESEYLPAYLHSCANSLSYYQDLVEELVDSGSSREEAQEDARYLLPNAAKTNITVTMNARELLSFFRLRMCKRAQWEIRELATKMLHICKGMEYVLFATAGADCMHGACQEGKHSCGNPYEVPSS